MDGIMGHTYWCCQWPDSQRVSFGQQAINNIKRTCEKGVVKSWLHISKLSKLLEEAGTGGKGCQTWHCVVLKKKHLADLPHRNRAAKTPACILMLGPHNVAGYNVIMLCHVQTVLYMVASLAKKRHTNAMTHI